MSMSFVTVCKCRHRRQLLLAAALVPWLHGYPALGASGGIVIYKDNSFDADSQAEIADYSAVEHFSSVDNVIATDGQTLRLQSGQEPIYIPCVGDPDSAPDEAIRAILAAEKRFPQYARKLEILRQGWAALPNAAPAATTGRAISASAESTSALTADEWKKKAIEEYPGLAVVGSSLNAAFVAKYKVYQGSNFFDSPDWPIRLAKECARAIPVTNAATLAKKLANTTWNDPTGQDSHGNQKSFTLNADMTARASWRHKELGWWKALDDSRIELHVARDTSVHAILAFNEDLTAATDDNNQSYHRLNPPVSQTTAQVQPPQQAPVSAPASVLRTKSGELFQSWSVTKIDGDAAIVDHADGISRVPISDFPDDLSKFPRGKIAPIQQFREQQVAQKKAEAQRAATEAPIANNPGTDQNVGKTGNLSGDKTIERQDFSISDNDGDIVTAMTAGPDGNVWFADNSGCKIGRVTTAGVTTMFKIPTDKGSPCGITAGHDGNLWFTEPTKIGRITTAGVITEFPIQTDNDSPFAITTGPDGNIWFTEPLMGFSKEGGSVSKIGRITPAGVITEFPIPTDKCVLEAITSGSDGNIWFTESNGNKIGRITPAGVIFEFPMPADDVRPDAITSGPDGNLWFIESSGHKIGRITPQGIVTEFPAPIDISLNSRFITFGHDGNLCFTGVNADGSCIVRMTTAGITTEYPTNRVDEKWDKPDAIANGPDGNLWVAWEAKNTITDFKLEKNSAPPNGIAKAEPTQRSSAVSLQYGLVGLMIHDLRKYLGPETKSRFLESTNHLEAFLWTNVPASKFGLALPESVNFNVEAQSIQGKRIYLVSLRQVEGNSGYVMHPIDTDACFTLLQALAGQIPLSEWKISRVEKTTDTTKYFDHDVLTYFRSLNDFRSAGENGWRMEIGVFDKVGVVSCVLPLIPDWVIGGELTD